MAITKILNINEAYDRNPGAHLEHAITYIQNPDKTDEKVLVGSINCLPETAFSQMMDTKQMFGKTGKRQGYHIVISFPPGEATPEQAMEVTRQFAEEHLGENYEVVYAVHTDKEHCHGHIIWNSVSLTTGYKYDSPKGNWKRVLQPLTNRLCKKLGLSIMPAEYAKEPKNLSRKEWELEQKRFTVGSAQFAKELQRFHQLQAEYLFLVDNNIKTIEDLILYKVKNEMRRDEIHARQQELYRKNSVQKRACKTVEDIREYQIWHMDIHAELDELKQEKKQIKDNLRIVDGCLKEKLYTASFDITDMEEYVKTTVELPEYSYTKKEEPETQSEAIEVVEVPVLSVEETTVDKSASKVETTQGEKSAEKLTYEEYCLLSPEEKAETVGFVSMRSFETVKSIVEILFYDMEHNIDVNEIMDESYEDYQKIYDKTVEMQTEKEVEVREDNRGRVR